MPAVMDDVGAPSLSINNVLSKLPGIYYLSISMSSKSFAKSALVYPATRAASYPLQWSSKA